MTTGLHASEYVLALADPRATLEVVGGKGASLARLAAAGLPVPDGFHVTTAAYQRFVAQLFDTTPLLPPSTIRERASFLEARADLSAVAVRAVPMYELHFKPDGSFWPLVEQL